jgi:hypothetical protein
MEVHADILLREDFIMPQTLYAARTPLLQRDGRQQIQEARIFTHGRPQGNGYRGVTPAQGRHHAGQIFASVLARAQEHRNDAELGYALVNQLAGGCGQVGLLEFKIGAAHRQFGLPSAHPGGNRLQRLMPERIA